MKGWFWAVPLLACLLGGCAGPELQASMVVSQYDDVSALKGKSLYVLGVPADFNESGEFLGYRRILEADFAQQGFVISHDLEHADLVATVSYGGGGQYTKQEEHVSPIIGQTSPGGTTYFDGTVHTPNGSSTFSGTAYTPPTYGVTSWDHYTTTSQVFQNYLNISLHQGGTRDPLQSKPLWMLKLAATSPCQYRNLVFPKVAQVVFDTWPGDPWNPKTVSVPMREADCRY